MALWKKSLDILLILDGGIKAFNLFSYNYYVSWDFTTEREISTLKKTMKIYFIFTLKKFCEGVKTTKLKRLKKLKIVELFINLNIHEQTLYIVLVM